jgi:Dyp-type peroxidase family
MEGGGGAMTLDDVQGNVLVGYGSDHAHYVFARVADPEAARRWLAGRLEHIRYNRSWGEEKPGHTVNIAFTHAGLLAMGVALERLSGLPAFTAGMEGRSEILGDCGDAGPETWEAGMRGTHLLVTLTAWKAQHLDGLRAKLAEHLDDPGNGLRTTHAQPAATLAGTREHFGFRDGFSQPAVAHAVTGPRVGEGVRRRWPPWRPWRDLALGEFILGHHDEGGMRAPAPAGPLGRDATFVAVRKLEQDVAAFRAYIAKQAELFDRDPEWIGAKMVGRWQNGSSLVDHPHGPGPPARENRDDVNQFAFGSDLHGNACPLGSHIRRSNPRDALGWQSKLTLRHRILRRGMSYGDPLPEGQIEPDGRERGLMFVCFQASIERQFEFIQKQWLGDGNVFGLGVDKDPIVAGSSMGGADRQAGMVIQGKPPLFLSGIPRFVTMRGGDYFLLPGRAGLEALAAGRT